MTWPREQGHISRTKGRRPLQFSENFTKGLKGSYRKIRSPASKTGGTGYQIYLGWHPLPPPHVRARVKPSFILWCTGHTILLTSIYDSAYNSNAYWSMFWTSRQQLNCIIGFFFSSNCTMNTLALTCMKFDKSSLPSWADLGPWRSLLPDEHGCTVHTT